MPHYQVNSQFCFWLGTDTLQGCKRQRLQCFSYFKNRAPETFRAACVSISPVLIRRIVSSGLWTFHFDYNTWRFNISLFSMFSILFACFFFRLSTVNFPNGELHQSILVNSSQLFALTSFMLRTSAVFCPVTLARGKKNNEAFTTFSICCDTYSHKSAIRADVTRLFCSIAKLHNFRLPVFLIREDITSSNRVYILTWVHTQVKYLP